jgi:hypothetical protein
MATVNAEIKMQGNDNAFFTTNAAVVYPANIQIFHTDGRYKFTDGVTDLATLPFRGAGGISTTPTLQEVTDEGNTTINLIEVGGLDNTDKLITLNKNGASSTGSGVQFEESGNILGYIKTAIGAAFDFLHPLNTFYARIALNLLTANRTYNLPNNSGTVALTSDIPSIATDYTQSFAYTGSPFTLTVSPTFIYSIRTTSMVLDENDVNDVTISGTTLTVINPAFQAGETLYIKYKA